MTDRGILVRGGYVLTSSAPEMIENGAVRILGKAIDKVGPWSDLRTRHPDDEVHGDRHSIITPGFVNTHGHFSEALFTGIAEDFTLWEWIEAVINPTAPHHDAEMAYVGTLLAGIQMLRTGITVASDMFVCDPADQPVTPGVVRALDELGMRGVVTFGAADRRGAPVAAILEEHAALREACEASRLSRFRVGIALLGAQSEALFEESVRLAADHGSHIHLHEVREEVTATRAATGRSPIEQCAHLGLLDGPTIAAHCVWVDENDRDILAEHEVGVAHNPVSNMILASGVCPVPALRRLGVAVGIGVDGPASNDRQDMLEAIKLAVLLQRVDRLQATALSARDGLAMATIEGARSLCLDEQLGSLEPGKQADLVVFDGSSPALANIHDPFQAVVYCAGPREVSDVWVAGSRSLANGQLTNVDSADVVGRSRPLARKLVRRAGIGEHSLLAQP
ncbi:MAG: amidohydrolase [bacterium]|nr:amidohydrolase [bacterium]MDE0288558.1 amidohydrolase [bacterium]MDE0438818.1 amidohydrolase [bacterium]